MFPKLNLKPPAVSRTDIRNTPTIGTLTWSLLESTLQLSLQKLHTGEILLSGNRLLSSHCREFPFFETMHDQYFARTAQFIPIMHVFKDILS